MKYNQVESKKRLEIIRVKKYTKLMVFIKLSLEIYGRILNHVCIG